MTSLTTCPAPLLRLILCGGQGLAPAWGPLACPDWSTRAHGWNPMTCDVTFPRGMSQESSGPPRPLASPEAWSIPLDAASPWPARLAMVAAWMLDVPCLAAHVQPETPELFFSLVMMPVDPMAEELRFVAWCEDGSEANTEANGQHGAPLPTLPHHLQTHPPAVALLLALYDVPEIRARVEQA